MHEDKEDGIALQKKINQNIEYYSCGKYKSSDTELENLDARNIVINIVNGKIFSLKWNSDLEDVVKEELGPDFTQKIKTAMGDEISFSTLFPIEESTEKAKEFYLGSNINDNLLFTQMGKISNIFLGFCKKIPEKFEDLQVINIFDRVTTQLLNLNLNPLPEGERVTTSESSDCIIKGELNFVKTQLKKLQKLEIFTKARAPAPTPNPAPYDASAPAINRPSASTSTKKSQEQGSIFKGITSVLLCDCFGSRKS
jgi:hypothetical protein